MNGISMMASWLPLVECGLRFYHIDGKTDSVRSLVRNQLSSLGISFGLDIDVGSRTLEVTAKVHGPGAVATHLVNCSNVHAGW